MVIVNVPNELFGGITLGVASFYYRFFHGRVLGISGFLNSSLPTAKNHDSTFKWLFLLGVAFAGASTSAELKVNPLGHWALLPLSGFLVGFGTKKGNGCTSGHGLCGLARIAQRSIIAVATFMATGMLTAASMHSESAPSPLDVTASHTLDPSSASLPLAAVTLCIVSYLLSRWQNYISSSWLKKKGKSEESSVFWGVIFGAGLILTEMTSQSRVFGFLSLPTLLFSKSPMFDPSLALVMGGGIVPSLIGHFLIGDRERPLLSEKSHLGHPNSKVTLKLVVGSAIFGVGWGLGGICPGPGIVLLFNDIAAGRFSSPIFGWTLCSLIGAKMASVL